MKSIEARFAASHLTLDGTLTLPAEPAAVVLFAHGSGSSRFSPRNNFVAGVLNRAGLGTLLFDLLTKEEEAIDLRTARLRFDISLLSQRLLAASDWLLGRDDMCGVFLGYFGSSTGGAAALLAAVQRPRAVRAIVCRGSRTDMAAGVLTEVTAPTLLIRRRSRYPGAHLEPRIFRRTSRRETPRNHSRGDPSFRGAGQA